MKTSYYKVRYIVFFILLLAALTALLPHADRTPQRVAKALRLTLPRGTETQEFSDTHGGFHGDGTTYAVLRLPAPQAEDFTAQLTASPDWHAFPLSDDAQIVFFGQITFEGDVSFTRGPAVPSEIPRPAEGLWYLRDRQSGETGSIFAESRSSLNFTAALWDSSRRTLYFIEADT